MVMEIRCAQQEHPPEPSKLNDSSRGQAISATELIFNIKTAERYLTFSISVFMTLMKDYSLEEPKFTR